MRNNVNIIQRPHNIEECDYGLFPLKTNFQTKRLPVTIYYNCFVAFNGIALKEFWLINDTVYGYKHFKWKIWWKGIEQYIVSRITKSVEMVYFQKEENKQYALVFQPWFNYYHWILESVPRLIAIHESNQKSIVFLPQSILYNTFVKESIKPFIDNGNIEFISLDKNAYFKEIVIPPLKSFCEVYDPVDLQKIRTLYLKASSETELDQRVHFQKIYVSRRKANRRKIENEDEVLKIVGKYGFEVIDFEDYSFFEQVQIMQKANVIISAHGAGLTNLLFMEPTGKVLELHKKITNPKDHHSIVYWTLASNLGLDYYHQICEPTDIHADFFQADIIVNTVKLEENILLMLNS
jgi:hypothetical protein